MNKRPLRLLADGMLRARQPSDESKPLDSLIVFGTGSRMRRTGAHVRSFGTPKPRA
jgi:hypothetical protein